MKDYHKMAYEIRGQSRLQWYDEQLGINYKNLYIMEVAILRYLMSNIFLWNSISNIRKDVLHGYFTDRYVKKVIHKLRLAGYPIVTSFSYGYKIATCPKEIRDYKKSMVKSVKKRFYVVNQVVKAGNKLFSKQEVLR